MRDKKFAFLCTQEERDLLSKLAKRFRRSQSDTVRYLIHLSAYYAQITGNREESSHPNGGENHRSHANKKSCECREPMKERQT